MRYEGRLYRPPSEAESYIVQATIGCSWNHCTYCDMYRDKAFRVRELDETLEDLRLASEELGDRVRKVFVADGDVMVVARMSYPRPVLAEPVDVPALDGSLAPHWVTEPLNVRQQDKPVAQTVEEALEGLAGITPEQVEAAEDVVSRGYRHYMHSVKTLDLQEKLQDVGFYEIKMRNAGRYDLQLPELSSPSFAFLTSDAPWMPSRPVLEPT